MSESPNTPAGTGVGGADTIDPHDRYLWDRTGPVDAAVALLERAAEPLRFKPVAHLAGRRTGPVKLQWRRGLAVAAVLALGAMVLLIAWPARGPAPGDTWTVTKSSDADFGPVQQLKIGTGRTTRAVTTGPAGTVYLEAEGGTRVQIGPGASANVLETGSEFPGLQVQQGRVSVSVGAAARPVRIGVLGELVSFAPGAAGTVEIVGKGAARVRLSSGTGEAVTGELRTRFAPGMSADMSHDGRLSVPLRDNADPTLAGAVRRLDDLLREGDMKSMVPLAEQITTRAMPADAPTVWNMMVRAQPQGRRLLRDALARLVKAPGAPQFDDVLKLEARALDAWWKAAIEAR